MVSLLNGYKSGFSEYSSSSNFIFILILVLSISFSSCEQPQNNPDFSAGQEGNEIVTEVPAQEELNKISKKISQRLDHETINIGISRTKGTAIPKESCDGKDNNGNGLVDEGCFACCPGAKSGDFDCDGKITMYDCTFPILYAYSRTTVTNSAICADLDKDSRVGMGDAIKCLGFYNAGN